FNRGIITELLPALHYTSNQLIASLVLYFFSFTHTSAPVLYTLSLHDALPIYNLETVSVRPDIIHGNHSLETMTALLQFPDVPARSEEHTSELQSHLNLVCRLLLEIKNRDLERRRLSAHLRVCDIVRRGRMRRH